MTGVTRRLAAVAFADIANWSRLVEQNDVDTLRAWKTLRSELIEPGIQTHGGRLVDLAGDAVLVEFPSAVEAVNWAIDLQRHPVNRPEAPGQPLRLRIGINVGDLIVDEGRLVGDGVNIASRIHQLVSPGEIVATETVRDHVTNRIPVVFRDLGERKLKNISRPIRIFRVEAPGLPAPQAFEVSAPETFVRTLLALDVPEAARLLEHDANEALAHWRKLQDQVAQNVLPASGGRVVRRLENGLLIEFANAQPAVRAAFAIQQACKEDAELNLMRQVLPRIGLQMGEVLADHSDLYGRSVNLAPRLANIAGPGEIVVSAAVRDELTPTLDADIEDLGECYLKDTTEPVRAYRLGPPGPRPVIEASGGSADDLRPTIAVIPFATHGVGYEAVGEVLAEEIIAALSRSADLNVISRLSTTAFRGRGATLTEVGAHLKASYVLSGAYRVSRRTLILSGELAETKSGRVVWANDLKGRVAGIIEGKEPLVDRIVSEASSAVMARELERTQSRAPQTLETCTLLIGAIALMHRLSMKDFQRANEMLRTVSERAPRLAIPQAWLAKWHVLRVWQGWSEDAAFDTRLALDCTRRALDADSHCSLALAIDGFVHTNLLKAFDVAQARYELALGVNPNDSLAWLLKGMLHAFKGEGRQAMKDTERALRLSPLDPHRYFYDSLAASAALAAEEYQRAIDLAQRSLRANRTHTSTHRVMAISQWQLGRPDEARQTVRALMQLEPTLTVTNWLARSPSSEYEIGKLCANALREAGVPN